MVMESSLTVISLVKRLHLSARAAIDAALLPLGVSAAQFAALRRLNEDAELTGAELARELFVTAQTMSRTLSRLEQTGLIERSVRLDNPNSTQNRLTPKGIDVVEAGRKIVQTIADQVLSPLSDDGRPRFEAALVQCIAVAETLPGVDQLAAERECKT